MRMTEDCENTNATRDRRRKWIVTSIWQTVVVVICLAAIYWWVLEGLIDHRWQSNETNAIAALKAYATAQITFRKDGYCRIAGNTSPALGELAFADNFRNLYYGRDKTGTGQMQLISKHFADAFIADNALSGAPTVDGATSTPTPYQGYLFQEDCSGALPADQYGSKFALMAFPAVYGVDGYSVFWINEAGAVYESKLAVKKGATATEIQRMYSCPTPLIERPSREWHALSY